MGQFKIVGDFTAYADLCFREFGDRVLHWATINEANVFAYGGYDVGITPPQRCSSPFGSLNCPRGNSTSEPYIVAHHILLAHSSTVSLFRLKYQSKQHGFIGLVLYTFGAIPVTDSKEDKIAFQRVKDFYFGWFLHPLVFGDYPETMKRNGGLRLPVFTNSESKLVKGSFDFIGVLYYSCATIIDNPESLRLQQRDFGADMAATINYFVDPVSSTSIFPIAPWGLRSFLEYIKEAYGNPPIYIYENGQRMLQNSSLDDIPRVNYLNGFIGGLLEALRNGSNTRGYFVWSFLDVLELFDGNEVSFGLYYVNLDDPDLKRYPKLSAISYSNFLKGKTFSSDAVSEVTKPSSLSYSLL